MSLPKNNIKQFKAKYHFQGKNTNITPNRTPNPPSLRSLKSCSLTKLQKTSTIFQRQNNVFLKKVQSFAKPQDFRHTYTALKDKKHHLSIFSSTYTDTPHQLKRVIHPSMTSMHSNAFNISDLQSEESNFMMNGEQYKLHPIENIPQFLSQLAHNELFFCCDCCQYAFPIEKSRHYPSCEDRNNFQHMRDKHSHVVMLLEKIVMLASYSKMYEEDVKKMHRRLVMHEMEEIDEEQSHHYIQNVRFMRLEDIRVAYMYVYDKFYKKYPSLEQYYCF